ncbi:prevent-host-death family protein [Candidatus Magnetoovum chiemensis]|nr:prevent-host-death family protein [Candidatus Magnetoovum chiemensis]
MISSIEAKEQIERLLEESALSHEPVQIRSGKASAVLVSEEDWRAIQETLYLLSIPNMREAIIEGLNTPIDECSEKLDW